MNNTSDMTSGPFLSGGLLQVVMAAWNQADGQSIIPVTDQSMLPLLQDGDQVLVAHGYDHVQPGDVIVFWQENALVVHRVLTLETSKNGLRFITKGDNTAHFDRPVPAQQVIGRLLSVNRGQRYLAMDTSLWRFSGRMIAASGLLWMKFDAWGQQLTKWFPHQGGFNRIVRQLQRGGRWASRLVPLLVKWLLCRGRI